MESTTQDSLKSKRQAPILTRENYRDWFQDLKDYFKGEGVFWVIQAVNTVDTPSSTLSDAIPGSLLQSQHGPEWEKANSKARYHMRICLSQDDRREIEELEKAKEVWAHLWSKYNKSFKADAMRLVKQFVNYEMSEEDTIRAAWVHLQNLGTRIAEIDSSQSHLKTKEERIKYLLAALPESYKSMKQAIQVQPYLTPDDILLLLESQEAEANRTKESAMFAKRGYQDSGSRQKCHLCEGDHWIKDCPGLSVARQAVKLFKVENPKRYSP
jgi:hypothetical protein